MKIQNYFSLFSLLGLSLFAAGCHNESVVGDEDSATGGGPAVSTLPERQAGDPACAAQDDQLWQELEDANAPNMAGGLAGHWSGITQSQLTVTLDLRKDGTGTVRFGDHAVTFEPATDPNTGYHCDWNPSERACMGLNGSRWLEGFPYGVHAAKRSGDQLTFTLEMNEPWSGWCALQTPHDRGDCGFSAYPNEEESWGDTCTYGSEPVDCGWLSLMDFNHVCECTSAQCFNAVSIPADMAPASLLVANDGSLNGWVGGEGWQLKQ